MTLREHSPPSSSTIFLNGSRFSPRSIASMEAPISSTPYFSSTPAGVQRDRAVERGLAAERGQQRVGALLRDHLLDELGRDRLDVRRVGELGVGHDRRRVGVDQDDPEALVLEHPAGLGPGVVELAGLADDDRAGADHQDARDVVALRHQALASIGSAASGRQNRSNRYAASCGPAAASGWYCTEKLLRSPSGERSSRPSTTSSLRQTWLTVATPYGVVGRPRRAARRPRSRGCAR